MLLGENFAIGIIKEVGDNDVVLSVDGEEITVDLSDEQAEELHQFLIEQDNFLIPINLETKELFLEMDSKWNEEDLEELIGISDIEEADDNE